MSSLVITVRNQGPDAPNILRGVLRNPVKLGPSAKVGLSSLSLARPQTRYIIDVPAKVGLRNGPNGANPFPATYAYLPQGVYTPEEFKAAVQRALNRCCWAWSNINQANSNENLWGYVSQRGLGQGVTGYLGVTTSTTFQEIAVSESNGNVFTVTRYAAVAPFKSAADGTSFANATPNLTYGAGSITIPSTAGASWQASLAAQQCRGSWAFTFNAASKQGANSARSYSIGAFGEGQQLLAGVSVEALYNADDNLASWIISLTAGERTYSTGVAAIAPAVRVSFYRIGGRIGWCLFDWPNGSDANTERTAPTRGTSVPEPQGVTNEWDAAVFIFSGVVRAFAAQGGQLVVDGLTLCSSPNQPPPPALAQTAFAAVFPGRAERIAAIEEEEQLAKAARAAERAAAAAIEEEYGVLADLPADVAGDSRDASGRPVELSLLAQTLAGEPAPTELARAGDVGVGVAPPGLLIPGDLADELGFEAPGWPGTEPLYTYAGASAEQAIVGDMPSLADGEPAGCVVLSSSIPLRGACFDDSRYGIDRSVLDSVVAPFSQGRTYVGTYRPPLYQSVANKSEMTVSELIFELVDVDGVSPFECLPGAVATIAVQGATF